MRLKAFFAWLALAVVSMSLAVLIFLPASWMGLILEKQSLGRLSLGDVQGSFWKGSAFLAVAADNDGPVQALFPGRFSWRISPMLLLGQVDLQVDNPGTLAQPLRITGNFSQWQVNASSIVLPPERLEGLGAPLNTIGPNGKLRLHWDTLELTRLANLLEVRGKMNLEMNDMSSRLSSIRPLGSYRMNFEWAGAQAQLSLMTVKGPMMLQGQGSLVAGKFQFSGKAFAQAGQEEKLANLLNLLGQRRTEGNLQFIALEFR